MFNKSYLDGINQFLGKISNFSYQVNSFLKKFYFECAPFSVKYLGVNIIKFKGKVKFGAFSVFPS